MPKIVWDRLKNERLKRTRGVSFEEVLQFRFVRTDRHRSRDDQEVMLFEQAGYIWVVPFIEKGEERFLKTLYPSRVYTKIFRKGQL